MLRPTAFLAVLLASVASAAHITITIPSHPLLANPATLPASTHATLHANGPPLSAPLSRSNTFTFSHVPTGSYLLTVHCRDFFFEPLRVDVGTDENGVAYAKSWQTFYGNEWDNTGEKRGEGVAAQGDDGTKREAVAVIESRVTGPKEYYQEREGFSVLSLFKNPMILMAVVSLGLILGMPYLMDNLDPEAKAEFEEMTKNNPVAANPAAAIQNFDLAGWMAGSKAPTPSAAIEEKRSAPSGGKRKG
ncbi:hypothetical protein FKW77_001092 [Venturia effusa]|uniref:ER membrane protein complex subunit 7 beta-sandwich domain-containing protein n=1 Tax=Venturia effusa TaxID=50376 RepID=A0A517LM59_9PEZI|nr:hypothetical protein FKW77_001092 [Venturia effusa]